jgi:hypothetical protein
MHIQRPEKERNPVTAKDRQRWPLKKEVNIQLLKNEGRARNGKPIA